MNLSSKKISGVYSQSKVRSMSKNRLKEEIGDVTRRAFNSSTSLGKVIGNVKINWQISFRFLSGGIGKIASDVDKNDGMLQIELSGIQSCFSDVISNLSKIVGFFKKGFSG